MNQPPEQLPEDVLSARRRYFNGEASPEDWALLQKYQSAGQVNEAKGDRSVVIGGNVSGSTIQTGDIYIFQGGPTASSEGQPGECHSRGMEKALEHELGNLRQEITELIRKDFLQAKEALREGKRLEANQSVKTIREDGLRWDAIDPDLQAEIIRFNALLHLIPTEDIEKAKLLAAEASQIVSGPGDILLQARIAYADQQAEKACEILQDQTDLDSLNFRAALFLEAGKLEEAVGILDGISIRDQSNAETYRLRAITQLILRNVTKAQMEIQTAVSFAPKWESIATLSAIIDFYSAISPAGLREVSLPWPEPIEPVLFLSDEESIERLNHAALMFQQLSEMDSKSAEERTRYKIWLAAALFGHPEKRQAAVSMWQEILAADPTDIRAIAWTSSFGIPVDLQKIRNALQHYVDQHGDSLPHIITLISVHLQLKNYKRARYLLDHYRAQFHTARAGLMWESRQLQLLLAQNRIDKALNLIEAIPASDDQVLLKAAVLEEVSKKTNDFQPYLNFLQTQYQNTGNPYLLLLLCRGFLSSQNWSALAEQAHLLISSVRTAEAVILSVYGTYSSNQPGACLNLLDENRELFLSGQFPIQVRKIRIACMDALGAIPGALAEAEALAHESPTTENLLTLAQAHFRMGDLPGLAMIGNQLLSRDDVPATECIQLGYWIRIQDLELSRLFWKKANAMGIPDTLLTAALYLSYSIGLDRDAEHLLARLYSLPDPETLGVYRFEVSQLEGFVKERQELLLDRNRIYQEGSVPIHAFANAVNLTLADIYHQIPERNASKPEPLHQPPLMIRSAGRSPLPAFELPFRVQRLHLDLTSLLLAAHLQVLEKIEAAFSPIYIPADTITALLSMMDAAQNHQLTQIEVARTIDAYIRQNAIKVISHNPNIPVDSNLVQEMGLEWASLFAAAERNHGYLLDYQPILVRSRGTPPEHLPENYGQVVVSCGSILWSLFVKGPLSEPDYQAALDQLYDQAVWDETNPLPSQGKAVYCWGNILDYFARANLLPFLCARFQMYISENEYRAIQQEMANEAQQEQTGSFLSQLLDHVRFGLSSGTYQPIHIETNLLKLEQGNDQNHPVLNSVRSLFLFSQQEGDVICVDDRFITAFAYQGTAPIIGMDEILRALVGKNRLDQKDYYELVLQMRSANFRYLPFSADELLFHVRNAPVVDGEVVETSELKVLKNYFAACLIDGRQFQKPSADRPAGPDGEMEFIQLFSEAVTGAIYEVWNDSNLEEMKRIAYANWILFNLHLDHAGLLHAINGERSEQNDTFRLAVSLVGLLIRGLDLPDSRDEPEQSWQKRYLGWLRNQLLSPCFASNPPLISSVADIIKYFLVQVDKDGTTRRKGMIRSPRFQAFILSLPKPVFEKVAVDLAFMKSLGLRAVLQIGHVAFDQKEFNLAVENLVARQPALIFSPDYPDTPVELHLDMQEGKPFLYFLHPESGAEVKMPFEIAPLFSSSPKEREQFLYENRVMFDLPDPLLKKAITYLAATRSLHKRLDDYDDWRRFNTDRFYASVRKSIIDGSFFRLEDALPPSGERLLHHYRLIINIAESQEAELDTEQAAQTLLSEAGIKAAIFRLAHLPIDLPQSITKSFAQLSTVEQEEIINLLVSRYPSPLVQLHAIHLITVHAGQKAQSDLRSNEMIHALLSEIGREQFGAFLAILHWAANALENWAELDMVPYSHRLALIWAHASRLYSTFLSAGVPVSVVEENFSRESHNYFPGVLFDRQTNIWFDIAHPRRISYASFLMAGISYGLGGMPLEQLSEDLSSVFVQFLKEEIEQHAENVLYFIRDDTLSPNSLGSFLASSHLAPSIQELKQSTQAWVQQALNRALQSDAEGAQPEIMSNWIEFYALVGDLPQNEQITEQICLTILKTKFSDLVERGNLSLSIQSLYSASLQLVHIHDVEVERHMRTELLELCRMLGEEVARNPYILITEEGQKENEYLFGILVETALNLAVSRSDNANVVKRFANILSEMIELCPKTAYDIQWAVWRLYHSFPIDQGQELLPLLLKLRSL